MANIARLDNCFGETRSKYNMHCLTLACQHDWGNWACFGVACLLRVLLIGLQASLHFPTHVSNWTYEAMNPLSSLWLGFFMRRRCPLVTVVTAFLRRPLALLIFAACAFFAAATSVMWSFSPGAVRSGFGPALVAMPPLWASEPWEVFSQYSRSLSWANQNSLAQKFFCTSSLLHLSASGTSKRSWTSLILASMAAWPWATALKEKPTLICFWEGT